MSEEVNEVTPTQIQSYITETGLPVGPQPDVEYPVSVIYCGNCGLPIEVCMSHHSFIRTLTSTLFFYTIPVL